MEATASRMRQLKMRGKEEPHTRGSCVRVSVNWAAPNWCSAADCDLRPVLFPFSCVTGRDRNDDRNIVSYLADIFFALTQKPIPDGEAARAPRNLRPGLRFKTVLRGWARPPGRSASRVCTCGSVVPQRALRLAARLEIRAGGQATLITISADGARELLRTAAPCGFSMASLILTGPGPRTS